MLAIEEFRTVFKNCGRNSAQPQTQDPAVVRRNQQLVMGACLRAVAVIHRIRTSIDYVLMEAVLDVRALVLLPKDPLTIRFVLCKKKLWFPIAVEINVTETAVIGVYS